MASEIFMKSLREQRGSFIGWTLGLAAYGMFTVALFPTIEGVETFQQYLEELPAGFRAFIGEIADIGTIEGFLTIEYLNYLPILLGVYAVIAGTRALVGEEEQGTMDLLLAHPLERAQVVRAKTLALLGSQFGIVLIIGVVLAVMGALVVEDPPLVGMFVAALNAFPAVAVIVMVAVASSALAHRRKTATIVTTVFLVSSFVLNGFAKVADWLEPGRYVSVFYYYERSDPFAPGIDPLYLILSALVAVVLYVVAVEGFDRKDIAV